MNKDVNLNRVRQYVDKITDGLNLKIDDGIKETVVFLNALGINTTMSCEGHLKWAFGGPWIDIGPKETRKFLSLTKRLQDIRKKLRIEERKKKPNKKVTDKLDNEHYKLRKIEDRYIRKESKKVFILLEKFYKNRKVDFDEMIILNSVGWGTRIMSQGTELQVLNDQKTREMNLKRYKGEMNLFTEFLKKEYFGK